MKLRKSLCVLGLISVVVLAAGLRAGSANPSRQPPTATVMPAPSLAGLPYVFAGTSLFIQCNQSTGANCNNTNPLFTPFSYLVAGATELSSSIVSQWWSQGLSNNGLVAANGPDYTVSSTINSDAPNLIFYPYGIRHSTYIGTPVPVPTWAVNQYQSASSQNFPPDHDDHMEIEDVRDGYAVGGFQCANTSAAAGGTYIYHDRRTGNVITVGPGSNQLACTYGEVFPFPSNGVSSAAQYRYGSIVHSGFQLAAVDVTPQEILNAEGSNGATGPPNGPPMAHALMIGTRCLNNPNVYPVPALNGTDHACTPDDKTAPGYPQYGDLVILNKTGLSTPLTRLSMPCQIILAAMQTYGAYLGDTGGATQILTLSDLVYTRDPAGPPSAWQAVAAQMVAGSPTRDATGAYVSGDLHSVRWKSCLDHFAAADFKIYQILAPS